MTEITSKTNNKKVEILDFELVYKFREQQVSLLKLKYQINLSFSIIINKNKNK